LSVVDLIPVASYLWLRGRCRTCGAKIPQRILWVELATGAAFGLLSWYVGLEPALAVVLFYFCLLLVIGVIDLEQGLILNILVYPGMVVALALGAVAALTSLDLSVVPTLGSAALGGGIGLVLFLLIVILSRGGMGLGDVKMAALLGLFLGFPLVFVGIFLAIFSGGLVAILLLLVRLKGRKQTVPFGPFLALGGFVALLWGPPILDWYLRLFGLT
jgi:leader peptidase (prepilin peptidase)/N-methyltransferase